jgi:glycerol-3-phosphate cytidylyltransferase-like family protein
VAHPREQHVCIKFCFELGKKVTENFQIVKSSFLEEAMRETQMFEWVAKFKIGVTYDDDNDDDDDDDDEECNAQNRRI